ncbi:hypothetical protein TRICI_002005 [Trichomonascus ciferrii]|uniref:Uncharacterized protein n=1 Tax=Trichomonascus ciferrii TaxID=44093 RepID=A0A642V7T7_9ASCO|nr:hypothetical protein TRICI_002005 [Trichomonascus ciferrii]
MLELLAVGGIFILLVVLLPVLKGIGSYKRVVTEGYEPRVKVVKKKKPSEEEEDIKYGYSSQYETVFRPNAELGNRRQQRVPINNSQEHVNPYAPQNSHIDNNFDYDKFINDQEKEDQNDRSDYNQDTV